MFAGSFFLIFLVIAIVNALRGGGGVSGDQRGRRHGRWTLVFIFLAVLLYVIADLTACFGWVRVSYYLGKLNIFSLGRDPKALDLYRAFQAASRISNEEKRREAMRWLYEKCHKEKGKLFSGQMIMFIIIDAQLTRPHDHSYLVKRLGLLKYIASVSIPKPVSILASKHALAPALANKDWNNIRAVCDQWDTPAKNYLVKYLREFHGHYICKDLYFSKINCWFYKLRILTQRELLTFCQQSLAELEQTQEVSTGEDPKIQLLQAQAPLESELITSIREELSNLEQKERWLKRAEELGVKQVPESWDMLMDSINQCNKLKIESEVIESEQEYQRFEQLHKNLFYINASISKKLDKKMKGSSLPHLLDWLQVMHILQELQINKANQLQAFDRIHLTLWDWVADLWNIRKDRCLVHQIAMACHPLAIDIGNREFAKVLTDITSGACR